MENSEWDDDDRRNRMDISTANHKLEKQRKKERRKALFRFALAGAIHQIKMIILVVAIIALVILLLCASAWYIVDEKDKRNSIVPGVISQINDNNA